MGRTIVVGDVHGCFDELTRLLEEVRIRPEDLLVSVGDLVDRGPEPGKVVDLFRNRPNSFVVMGNHERKHVRGLFSYSQEITRLQFGDDYGEAVEWMGGLPYFFEDDHVRVVHAAALPGIPLQDQPEEVLCGSTRGERELEKLFPEGRWYDHYTDAKPVAFGHHVTGREPLVLHGRIFGLDTGACHGWNLTAVCFPRGTVHSVRASADHWSTVRRRWQLPVLRARPWREVPWQKLAQDLERVSTAPDPALGRWLAGLRTWAEGLRAPLPVLAAETARISEALTEAEMREHPAAKLLFAAQNGRLDETVLSRRCTTPGATIDLAAELGLALDEPPR